MLLAIDIGNTNTVIGLLREEKVLYRWRLESQARRTEDEWYTLLRTLIRNESLDTADVTGVIISSVVPGVTGFFRKMSVKYLDTEPIIITGRNVPGLRILYENPDAVGADRICNAISGYVRYGGPLIIIDFGTATTYDVIGADGEYVGGVISPGLETAARHLHKLAAKLPSVELVFPEKVVAGNTEQSMQAGIMYGAVDAVNGMVGRIERELGGKCTVIATGGIGGFMKEHITDCAAYEPDLTLTGMGIIYRRISDASV